jgi:hypothetical protein
VRRYRPDMRHWLLCAIVACWPCLLGLGCNAQPSVAHAAERAQPFVPAFAQFDRWARRAVVSERAVRDLDALTETTFAPIRSDRAIAAAWLDFEGKHGFMLAFPPNAAPLPELGWVMLRDPELGPLRVAIIDHCRDLLAHTTHVLAADRCVLISRSEAAPAPGATRVTLAFEASVQ